MTTDKEAAEQYSKKIRISPDLLIDPNSEYFDGEGHLVTIPIVFLAGIKYARSMQDGIKGAEMRKMELKKMREELLEATGNRAAAWFAKRMVDTVTPSLWHEFKKEVLGDK